LLNVSCFFTTNSVVANYSSQSFCLWSTKNHKYYSSFWFICSVWLFICKWNDVDNFVPIPSILFNFFVNSATNYGSLFNIILSENSCNFHILSLNNFASPSTDVSSIVTCYKLHSACISTTSRPIFTNWVVLESPKWGLSAHIQDVQKQQKTTEISGHQ